MIKHTQKSVRPNLKSRVSSELLPSRNDFICLLCCWSKLHSSFLLAFHPASRQSLDFQEESLSSDEKLSNSKPPPSSKIIRFNQTVNIVFRCDCSGKPVIILRANPVSRRLSEFAAFEICGLRLSLGHKKPKTNRSLHEKRKSSKNTASKTQRTIFSETKLTVTTVQRSPLHQTKSNKLLIKNLHSKHGFVY